MSIIVKSSFNGLPPGTHGVRVSSLRLVPNKLDESKQQLEVTLEAVNYLLDHAKIRFWSSAALHEKGRLVPFIQAVIKRPLSSAELSNGFDVDQLLGQELRIIVKEETSLEGKVISKVADFLPSEI